MSLQVSKGSLLWMLRALNSYFKQLFLKNKQQVLDKSRIKVSCNSNSHCSVWNCQDTDHVNITFLFGKNVIKYWYKLVGHFVGPQLKSHSWIQWFNYTCSGVLSKIRFSCSFRLLSWSASNTYILVSWLEPAFSWKGYSYCCSCVCTNSSLGEE